MTVTKQGTRRASVRTAMVSGLGGLTAGALVTLSFLATPTVRSGDPGSIASVAIAASDLATVDEVRRPAEWGEGSFRALATDVRDGWSAADTRALCTRATWLVSRMRNGPRQDGPREWSSYLSHGLGPGSCSRRAMLMAAILFACDPDLNIRFAGMASVPSQGAHSTLEVWLPEQQSWAWFDPSAGIFVTESADPDGRILSQQEVFADPHHIEATGAWASIPIDRFEDSVPAEVRLPRDGSPLFGLTPGFALPSYPFQAMLEQASGWASGDPSAPTLNRIPIDLSLGSGIVAATLDDDGRVTRQVVRVDDRRIFWADRVGVSGRGLNTIPSLEVSGLRPGGRYRLTTQVAIRWSELTLAPIATFGARVASVTHTPDATGDLATIETVFVAAAERGQILMLHNGKAPGQRGVVLHYLIEEVDADDDAQF